MDDKNGVLYLASGEDYLQQATRSAKSLKQHHPDLPITIHTDEKVLTEVFDTVVHLTDPISTPGDSILSEDHFPYDRTLFLDADTYVCGNITDVFELLDTVDVAAAHEVGRAWWNRETYTENGIKLPDSFPEYNTGVLAYRDTKAVHQLFKTWNEKNKAIGGNLNQPAFRVASYRSEANFTTLPPEYNFMTHTAGFASGPVKILHQGPSNVNLQNVAERINSRIGARVIAWDKELCRVVSNERLDERTGTAGD